MKPLSRSRRPGRGPGPPSGFFRVLSGIFTLLVLGLAIVGIMALALQSRMNAPGPLATSKVVAIPRGESVHGIAARLEREGAISDRRLFMAAYYLERATAWSKGAGAVHLKAGSYQIPRRASIRHVIDILADGRTITHRVTIPEGLTSHQIVERLKADPNLEGEIERVPAEGSLLPETFIVQRGAQRQDILDKMRAERRKLKDKLWAQRQEGLPFKTWEEAVVLASIVEKETGRNDERERVAAVFVNRLRRGMRLQSDPTILYGISTGKTVWNRPIMKSDIAQKTAHNTYQIDGLPPTPICNPGRAAIEAVLNPAKTEELYFVADGNGGHIFAETLKEHNANVRKWRALERRRAKEEKEREAREAAARESEAKKADKAADPTLSKSSDEDSKDDKDDKDASEASKSGSSHASGAAKTSPASGKP